MTTEATANDAPIVQVTDAGVFYRASALGGCFRALWAARNGYDRKPPPERLQAAFDQGHEIEELVIQRLIEEGWNIYDQQREIVIDADLAIDYPVHIVGHIDALGMPPEGKNVKDPEAHLFEHLVEIKGLGPDLFRKYKTQGIKAFPRYTHQIAAYCAGIPCADVALVIYEKETGEIHVEFFENKIPKWELSAICLAVEEMTRTQTLPTCTNEYGCPYYYMHDPKDVAVPLAPTADTLVQALLNIEEQRKTLDEARKMMIGQLEEIINWVEGAPMSYDSSLAVINVVMNPRSLDTAKIRQLLDDAELDPEDYTRPSSGWHLRINPKAR
jgi:hypothetical protein